MPAARPSAPSRGLDGPPPPQSEQALDHPVDEPDLASWAWHRATGAAAAVLVAAALGAAIGGPGGAFAATIVASVVAYGAGPLIAAAERRVLRHGPVTPRRLRRTWVLAVLVLLVATTAVGVAGDGGLLFLPVYGGPIALAAAWLGVVLGLALPAGVGRPLAVGVPAGLAVAVGAAAGVSLVDAALVLAVVVIVPATVPLLPWVPGAAGLLGLLAGLPAAVSLVLEPGPAAVLLVAPWVVSTGVGAALTAWRWWASARRPADLVWPAAAGYLAFGSLWLLADRAALEPAGFGAPFVQLTAVHFTYAGFVAAVLAGRAWRRRPHDRVAATAVGTIVAAPPLVAVGFSAAGVLQVVGAVSLTVGTWALAWVTVRRIVPRAPRVAAWCLGSSSVSVLAPMLLAVQWAVGANLGTPALTIAQMAATHGVANALGFSLLGVVGWRLLDRDAPAGGPAWRVPRAPSAMLRLPSEEAR